MSLVDFLYRCPLCGHDPLEGAGDMGRCRGCGSRFARAGRPALIRVWTGTDEGGSSLISAQALSRAMSAFEPAAPWSPLRWEGHPAARVFLSRAEGEEPFHHQGRLQGFVERMIPRVEGLLVLEPEKLRFLGSQEGVHGSRKRSEVGPAGGEGSEPSDEWPLHTIQAVQTASSAVQLYLASELLLHFRFPDDSPRRWDELLRNAIQAEWHRLGRGTIVEFQPRIVTR